MVHRGTSSLCPLRVGYILIPVDPAYHPSHGVFQLLAAYLFQIFHHLNDHAWSLEFCPVLSRTSTIPI